jgi:hypothetical protein
MGGWFTLKIGNWCEQMFIAHLIPHYTQFYQSPNSDINFTHFTLISIAYPIAAYDSIHWYINVLPIHPNLNFLSNYPYNLSNPLYINTLSTINHSTYILNCTNHPLTLDNTTFFLLIHNLIIQLRLYAYRPHGGIFYTNKKVPTLNG